MRVNFADVKAVRTRYYSAGEGKPVLLIHGVGVGADSWFRNIPSLGSDFFICAPDVLANAFTDDGAYKGGPPHSYMVDHLIDILDHLGLENVSVVGSSFGSVLAVLMYLRAPARIERLVLVGSGPALNSVTEMQALYEKSFANGRKALADPTYDVCRQRMGNLVFDPAAIPVELLLVQMTAYALPGALASYERRMVGIKDIDSLKDYALVERLSEVAAPTLVIWGRQDPRGNYTQAVEAVKRLPRGRMITYEDCGHFPQLEYPEKFNEDVREFLK